MTAYYQQNASKIDKISENSKTGSRKGRKFAAPSSLAEPVESTLPARKRTTRSSKDVELVEPLVITPTRDRKAKQQRLEEQRLRIDTEAAAQAVPGTFLDSDPGQGDGRFWGPPSGIEEEVPSEERSLIQEHAPFDSSESQATSSPPPPFEEVLNQSQQGPELSLPTQSGNSESKEEHMAKDIIKGELSLITPSEISTTTNDNNMGSNTMPVRGARGACSFDPTVHEELPWYWRTGLSALRLRKRIRGDMW